MPLFNFRWFCETADRASQLTVMRWTMSNADLGQAIIQGTPSRERDIPSSTSRRWSLSQCETREVLAIKLNSHHFATKSLLEREKQIEKRLDKLDKILARIEDAQDFASDTRLVTKRDMEKALENAVDRGVGVGAILVTIFCILPYVYFRSSFAEVPKSTGPPSRVLWSFFGMRLFYF